MNGSFQPYPHCLSFSSFSSVRDQLRSNVACNKHCHLRCLYLWKSWIILRDDDTSLIFNRTVDRSVWLTVKQIANALVGVENALKLRSFGLVRFVKTHFGNIPKLNSMSLFRRVLSSINTNISIWNTSNRSDAVVQLYCVCFVVTVPQKVKLLINSKKLEACGKHVFFLSVVDVTIAQVMNTMFSVLAQTFHAQCRTMFSDILSAIALHRGAVSSRGNCRSGETRQTSTIWREHCLSSPVGYTQFKSTRTSGVEMPK